MVCQWLYPHLRKFYNSMWVFNLPNSSCKTGSGVAHLGVEGLHPEGVKQEVDTLL